MRVYSSERIHFTSSLFKKKWEYSYRVLVYKRKEDKKPVMLLIKEAPMCPVHITIGEGIDKQYCLDFEPMEDED